MKSVSPLGAARVPSVRCLVDTERDDELHIGVDEVRWLVGAQCKGAFRVEAAHGHILAATWAAFGEHAAVHRHLCALQRETLVIFAPDGDTRTVPLPFRARRVLALECGVLIERCVTAIAHIFVRSSQARPQTTCPRLGCIHSCQLFAFMVTCLLTLPGTRVAPRRRRLQPRTRRPRCSALCTRLRSSSPCRTSRRR